MTQKHALDILKAGHNVYLTGVAGSGKTYLLQQFILHLNFQRIRVGITASTGVAATHLSGMTIHSWAGIGVRRSLTESDIDEILQRKHLRRRFEEAKVLIIDEISMLPSHTLEAVDTLLRAYKENDEPFGGIQVVLCGDFFQLPPVSEANSRQALPEFVFKSPLWDELALSVCYLDKPYRQNDTRFLSMLDAIRENNVGKEIWELLKERFIQPIPSVITPTKLYTHNSHADMVNNSELAKINEVPHSFEMEVKGDLALAQLLSKNCLAPQRLVLKVGAQVMFVKNNHESGYSNGTMGRVLAFNDEGLPVIETLSGKQITAYPQQWEIDDPTTETKFSKAKVIQIPLRLAWAITIHKSQGMSLDAAEIDLGKSFVEGLGYVALSRVRTLEGIKLRSINRTALSVNSEVMRFDRKLREASDHIASTLQVPSWYENESYHEKA